MGEAQAAKLFSSAPEQTAEAKADALFWRATDNSTRKVLAVAHQLFGQDDKNDEARVVAADDLVGKLFIPSSPRAGSEVPKNSSDSMCDGQQIGVELRTDNGNNIASSLW